MVKFSDTVNNKVTMELDTAELTPAQVRTLKTINTLLAQLAKTTIESEFFENSAEVMRLCASIVQQANFPMAHKGEKIPYAHQALEYALDVVQEQMMKAKIVNYDN